MLEELQNANNIIDIQNFWDKSPWGEHEVELFNLEDLPCRLNSQTLMRTIQKFSFIAADGAEMNMKIPHPRHDQFLIDMSYVKAILPETLAELDPRVAKTSLYSKLGINFEVMETSFLLDPNWQTKMEVEKLNFDDIFLISKQLNNVIHWFTIKLKIHKILWTQKTPKEILLTPEMQIQLKNQIESHKKSGDLASAKIVEDFVLQNMDGKKND